jgi:hypothetical protein
MTLTFFFLEPVEKLIGIIEIPRVVIGRIFRESVHIFVAHFQKVIFVHAYTSKQCVMTLNVLAVCHRRPVPSEQVINDHADHSTSILNTAVVAVFVQRNAVNAQRASVAHFLAPSVNTTTGVFVGDLTHALIAALHFFPFVG